MTDKELDEIAEDWLDRPYELIQGGLTDADLKFICDILPMENPFEQELEQRSLVALNINELRLLGDRLLEIPMYERTADNPMLQYIMALGQQYEEQSWTVLAKSLAAL